MCRFALGKSSECFGWKMGNKKHRKLHERRYTKLLGSSDAKRLQSSHIMNTYFAETMTQNWFNIDSSTSKSWDHRHLFHFTSVFLRGKELWKKIAWNSSAVSRFNQETCGAVVRTMAAAALLFFARVCSWGKSAVSFAGFMAMCAIKSMCTYYIIFCI